MRIFHLRRTLLPILGLLLAVGAAAGGVPDPATSSVPNVLTLVGKSGAGEVDSSHPFVVVVRDLFYDPMPGITVVLDFSAIPDLWICSDQQDPSLFVDCGAVTIAGITDGNGAVTFHIAGCAANSGGAPGPSGPAMKVYAEGVPLRTVRVAALDQNGDDGVGGSDFSAWLADFYTGQMFSRSDFDGDGSLGGNDASLWLAAFYTGASALGCGTGVCRR